MKNLVTLCLPLSLYLSPSLSLAVYLSAYQQQQLQKLFNFFIFL